MGASWDPGWASTTASGTAHSTRHRQPARPPLRKEARDDHTRRLQTDVGPAASTGPSQVAALERSRLVTG